MAYFQTNYAWDDPDERRAMRVLAGLDPEDDAAPPAAAAPAPAVTREQPPQQELVHLEAPVKEAEHPDAAAFRALVDDRPLTSDERAAERSAIDADGEQRFASAINDIGVLAALLGDIAGNRGRGIGKLGGAWATGKMQAADRDRAIAQRNRELAGQSADRAAAQQADIAAAAARQGVDVASREKLNREDQEGATGRTQLQIDAENLRAGNSLKSLEEREAAELVERRRLNDINAANIAADNAEANRHNIEAEKNARNATNLGYLTRKDANEARAEEARLRREERQGGKELLHADIPGIERFDDRAWAAGMLTAGMREKAIEARTTLGAAADAAHTMIEIRERLGIADPQRDARDISRFNQAKKRFIGALGAASGTGNALSDKEREQMSAGVPDLTFGTRDALDALAAPFYGKQDSRLEALKGNYQDIVSRVNTRLAPIGGRYKPLAIADDDELDRTPGSAPKVRKYVPGMFSNPGGGL